MKPRRRIVAQIHAGSSLPAAARGQAQRLDRRDRSTRQLDRQRVLGRHGRCAPSHAVHSRNSPAWSSTRIAASPSPAGAIWPPPTAPRPPVHGRPARAAPPPPRLVSEDSCARTCRTRAGPGVAARRAAPVAPRSHHNGGPLLEVLAARRQREREVGQRDLRTAREPRRQPSHDLQQRPRRSPRERHHLDHPRQRRRREQRRRLLDDDVCIDPAERHRADGRAPRRAPAWPRRRPHDRIERRVGEADVRARNVEVQGRRAGSVAQAQQTPISPATPEAGSGDRCWS